MMLDLPTVSSILQIILAVVIAYKGMIYKGKGGAKDLVLAAVVAAFLIGAGKFYVILQGSMANPLVNEVAVVSLLVIVWGMWSVNHKK